MNKPKAYSYIRWSSERQTKGSSLERQLTKAREIAEDNNLELIEIMDAGVSSFHSKNIKDGALGAFIKAVKDGVIPSDTWLICENLDRLSRDDIFKSQTLFMGLLDTGITIVTGMDGNKYTKESVLNNNMELMYSIMLFGRAHDESKTKSDRTNKSAIIAIDKFNNGVRSQDGYAIAIKAVGSHPWMFDTSETVLIEGKAYSIVKEHPYYWKVAKDIANKILSGWGSYKLCEYLNDTYEPPKKRANKKREGWAINLIRNFHKQDYVRGTKKIQVANTDYELDGYYPRVVTDTEFYQMQQARNKNRITTTSRKHVGLISGIRVAKCGHCTDSIGFFTNRRTKKGADGEQVSYQTLRYICLHKQVSTKNCVSSSMDATKIEDAVIRLCLSKIWKHDTNKQNTVDIEIYAKESKLSELMEKQENLADNLENMKNVPQFMLQRANSLDVQVSEAKQSIEDIKNKAVESDLRDIPDIELLWQDIPPNVLIKENDQLRTKVRKLIQDSIKEIKIYKIDGGQRAGHKLEITFHDGEVVVANRTQTKLTLLSGLSSIPVDVELTTEEAYKEFDTIQAKLESLLFWNMDDNQKPMLGAPQTIDRLLPFKDGDLFTVLHPPELA